MDSDSLADNADLETFESSAINSQDSEAYSPIFLTLGRKELEHNAFTQIRKATLDPYNRLHSIDEDASFISAVFNHYGNRAFPLLANLRCGAWYADPSYASEVTAYFKSSDGHYNGWSFNLRRPNLHILPLIDTHHGIFLVDSTRAGKRMPDSFSKTVPIWCAVINRALKLKNLVHGGYVSWDVALYTAPQSVSKQEHSQIEEKLDAWAHALANSSYELLPLAKPLRPIWITPASTSFPDLGEELPFYPIICISASKLVEEGIDRRSGGYSYVQGSGDDHEHWSSGLTPILFWEHRDDLLSAAQDDVSDVIDRIVAKARVNASVNCGDWVNFPIGVKRIENRILLCRVAEIPPHVLEGKGHPPFPIIVLNSEGVQTLVADIASDVLLIPIPSDKKAAERAFKSSLSPCLDFIERHLQEGRRVCIACETGKDLSVGVAVAALQAFWDDDGLSVGRRLQREFKVNKDTLRVRLHWIIASNSEANPSRATLKRVNEFFLSASYKLKA